MLPIETFQSRRWLVLVAYGLALALLALPGSSVATVLLIALGAVVALVSPPVMIAVVVLSVPLQDMVVRPFAGGSVTITQMALFALFAGWGVLFWRRTIWLDGFWWWSLAVIGSLIISFVATDDAGIWAEEVYRWGVAVLFYLVCRSTLRDWASIRMALWAMAIGVASVSAFGFGQFVAKNGPEHMIRGGVLRVYGPFGTPNPFAAYMELTVPLLMALVLVGWRQEVRRQIGQWLWFALTIATGMGASIIALTQSRGGYIGFAAALLVLLVVMPMRLRIAVIGTGVVLLTAFLLTAPGRSQLERFGEVLDSDKPVLLAVLASARTGREELWDAAIGMFRDHPWTGVGAGEFDFHFRQYTTDWYSRWPLGQAHSGYLHMAAQAGVVGVVTFVGWLTAMLVSLLRAVRRGSDPLSRAAALGALAVAVAFVVHSVVDYLNVLSLGLQLGAVVAIGLNLVPHAHPAVAAPERSHLNVTPSPSQAGNA